MWHNYIISSRKYEKKGKAHSKGSIEDSLVAGDVFIAGLFFLACFLVRCSKLECESFGEEKSSDEGGSILGNSIIVPTQGLEPGDKGVAKPNGVDEADEKSSLKIERLSTVLRGESNSVSGTERGFQMLNCKGSRVRVRSAGIKMGEAEV